MRVVTTERWEYIEYTHYETPDFPEGWDDWGTVEKYQWTIDNGEYVRVDSEPVDQLDVEDVEAI